ncbi:polyhomeotic-like protein 1 isoform 2-T2 [Anomaloglossus baeobatrachus]|uniref:polyhomeotic-like protein 1 isoform X2 n=1 Tax=Anomaloglossus baeobatrachus TaxID=238106 RepID=UPI003F4FE148
METESEQNSTSTNGSTASSASSRPQISQMSLYERQAVQALQALHRQPNAAQYFHQLMLQQQLSNAQLHSLAAVQQATIAATRQAASPNTVSNQQTSTTQGSQVNLSTSSSAQLLSRAQNVTAPSATTLTQSVLLSNASSPPLSQSQTQMYLRQPQLGNLLQVNRSLNRGVPLNSQLILMPNGSVATVQQEVASPQNQGMHQDSDQVQNLAVRGQQTTQPTSSAAGPTIAHAAPPLSKPATHSMPSSSAPSQLPSSPATQTVKSPMGPAGGTVSQGSQTETEVRKAEGDAVQQSVGINLTRAATPAPNQTLISSATYTHIQPHSVLQQKQVVFQQQIAIHQHRQSQLVHASAHLQLAQQPQATSQQGLQAAPAQQTLVVQPMLQSPEATLPTKAPVPIQPKQPGKGVPPLNLQGHLAAKPTQSARPLPTPPPNQPHIPVQLVGARQQGPAQAMALGAPQVPSQGSSLTQITMPQSPAPVPSTVSGNVQEAQAAFYGVLQSKMSGAAKRKSEEDREESLTLPVKTSPPADSPPTVEESSTPADKSEAASQVSPALAVSAPPCAPTISVTSRQHSDTKPPQAIVKPQILTHIIEGFVIQEGAEPFPVGSPQVPKDPEKTPAAVTAVPPLESPFPHPPLDQTVGNFGNSKLLKCEYCGKVAPADQFRGTKRFCSMACAKRYNVSCSHKLRLKRKKLNQLQEAGGVRVRRRGPRRNSSEIARAKIQGKRMRVAEEDSSRGSDNSSYEEAFSPTSPAPPSCRTPQRERDGGTPTGGLPNSELLGINPVFLSSNPSRWSVEEVYEFISSLQGCQDLAEDFRSQEIDGQALLLLKEEHLMSALNIKLGPALKICAKINLLKET